MGAIRSFVRVTTLFALVAASLSAAAMDSDRVPGAFAAAALRNAEDCLFYARAYEHARAMESRLRLEEARAVEAVRAAEAAVRTCVEANGIAFDAASEYDVAQRRAP